MAREPRETATQPIKSRSSVGPERMNTPSGLRSGTRRPTSSGMFSLCSSESKANMAAKLSLRLIEGRSPGLLPFSASAGEQLVLLDNGVSAALAEQQADFAGGRTEIQDRACGGMPLVKARGGLCPLPRNPGGELVRMDIGGDAAFLELFELAPSRRSATEARCGEPRSLCRRPACRASQSPAELSVQPREHRSDMDFTHKRLTKILQRLSPAKQLSRAV